MPSSWSMRKRWSPRGCMAHTIDRPEGTTLFDSMKASSSIMAMIGLAAVITAFYGWRIDRFRSANFLTSRSPQGDAIVYIHRTRSTLDFNLRISLETSSQRKVVMSQTPDEGMMSPGDVRVTWSSNGDWFLVSGARFYVHEHSPQGPPGDRAKAYLLYQISTGSLYCNSRQLNDRSIRSFDCVQLNSSGIVGWTCGE